MNEVLQFILRHGYAVLFAVVFLESAGVPIASVPVLLGIGALAVYAVFAGWRPRRAAIEARTRQPESKVETVTRRAA